MTRVNQNSNPLPNNSNFISRTFASLPSAVMQIFSFMKACKTRVFSVIYCPQPVCDFYQKLSNGFSALATSVTLRFHTKKNESPSNSLESSASSSSLETVETSEDQESSSCSPPEASEGKESIEEYSRSSSTSSDDKTAVPPIFSARGTMSGVMHNPDIKSKKKQPMTRAVSVFGLKGDRADENFNKLNENIPHLKGVRNSSIEFQHAIPRVAEAIIELTKLNNNSTLLWELELATAGARHPIDRALRLESKDEIEVSSAYSFMNYARFKELREHVRNKKNAIDRIEENIPLIVTHCIVEYTLGILENQCNLAEEIDKGQPHSIYAQSATALIADYTEALVQIKNDLKQANADIQGKIKRGSKDLYLNITPELLNKQYFDIDAANDLGTSNFGTIRYLTYVNSLRG